MTWTEDALCYGMDPGIWFEDEPNYDLETAREICARCPVAGICLADALAREKRAEARARAGVCAGTTPEEREALATGKPRVRTLNQAEHDERMRLYDLGFNDAEIGERTGVRRNRIYDWRRRNKLPRKDQAGQARRSQWEHLYSEGYPDAEIAHLTQTTVAAVKSWRQRMDYEPNSARVSA